MASRVGGLRFDAGMPELTRRRYKERADCWQIYFDDVQAGTIAKRTGAPIDKDPWEWSAGFYPGCEPGEIRTGTAVTFDHARADFEQAWRVFLSNRTEADFQEWRDARDWTARKYAMWAAGERLPSQKRNSLMRCSCGEVFDSHKLENNLIHVPHITKAHKANEIRRQQTAE